MLPLEGVTVVAIEQAIAVPYATRQLAELGARVIKIERPGEGDFARGYDTRVRGLASYFVWANRSKQSLTLDLKHPEARAIVLDLIDRADVVVQNLAPGATRRLGLGSDELRRTRPRLITCDLTGYGTDGPYRDKKAYDLLVQCEAGVLAVTGTPEEPAKAGISVADISAGMAIHAAVLAALLQRGRTGEGAALETSLFATLTEWMGHPLYYTMETGEPPPRTGASHASIAPYGIHRTGDGRSVQFGIQNEREWRRFCDGVLGRPGLADDPRFATVADRVRHRPELTALIEAAFADLGRDAVVALLDAAQIANASMNDIGDVLRHPQLRWTEVGTPAGPIPALEPPVSGLGHRMDPVPALGEHTDAILAELGRPPAEIARLRAAGAV